jgi:hypothetical protein
MGKSGVDLAACVDMQKSTRLGYKEGEDGSCATSAETQSALASSTRCRSKLRYLWASVGLVSIGSEKNCGPCPITARDAQEDA